MLPGRAGVLVVLVAVPTAGLVLHLGRGDLPRVRLRMPDRVGEPVPGVPERPCRSRGGNERANERGDKRDPKRG